jgi:hypothetical protein
MGNRVGLARTQALIQGLKRELALTSTTLNGVKIGMPDTVTAATTLTSADSNKVIRFDIASSDVTVTLPTTVTAGLTYTFLCVGTSAKSLLIDAGSASVVGTVVTFAVGSSVSRAAYNQTVLGFADNHIVGDHCTIIGDGANWRIPEATCATGFTAS